MYKKKCLRNIYGYGLSYEEVLELSGLDTREERRRKALHKFANRAAVNPQFEHWFPLNKNRSGRHGKKYEELMAKVIGSTGTCYLLCTGHFF